MRTVASLGLEGFAIERFDAELVLAERVAIRTVAKLSLATSTITAFVYYVCGAASLYSLSQLDPELRDSAFAFRYDDATFCVPAACDAAYDPNILAANLVYANQTGAIQYGASLNPAAHR